MALPNFLIVGAMKSGTSTLRAYLREVDQIFMAADELHFFSDDDKYSKGLGYYEQFFASAGPRAVIGEKTATYSYVPTVPSRIARDLPDAKLIWIFREPVARTYSHYWHSVKNGSEPLGFDAAIEHEEERVRTDIWRGYMRRSLYAEQVQRFLDVVTPAHMLYLLFEDLIRNPDAVVNKVLRFLEVPASYERPGERLHANATYVPRSARVQWLTRHLLGRGTRGWHLVQKLNRRHIPGYPPMSQESRFRLEERFRASNTRLVELTGLDLSVWSSASGSKSSRCDEEESEALRAQ